METTGPRRIATTDRRKLIGPLITFCVILLSPTILVSVAAYFDFRRGNVTWNGWKIFFYTFMCMAVVQNTIKLISVLSKIGREVGLSVDSEYFNSDGRDGPTRRIRLDNIAEIHIRTEGSFRHHYLDKGMALILIEPEYLNQKGVLDRNTPTRFFRNLKCHYLTTPSYFESIEQIAFALAAAAQRVTGIDVPVLTNTKEGAIPVAARPAFAGADTDGIPLATGLTPAGIECVECGYDLRLQGVDSRCPECGTLVRRSISGKLLSVADRRWVTWLMTGCMALSLAGLCGMSFLWILHSISTSNLAAGTLSRSRMLMAACAFVVGIVALVVGAWLITKPEPVIRSKTDDPRFRRLARLALLPPILVIAARYMYFIATGPAFFLVCGCVLLLSGFCLLYSRSLLRRLSKPGWIFMPTIAAVECFSTFAIGILMFAIFSANPSMTVPPPAPVVTTAQSDDEAPDSKSPVATKSPAGNASERFDMIFMIMLLPMPTFTAIIFLCMAIWMFRAARAPRNWHEADRPQEYALPTK